MKIDLAIVGAGPAGQAAAEVAVSAGLSVAIIDEQARAGGQILRQPPATFGAAKWLPGRAYRNAKAQLERFEALPELHWLPRHSVTGVFREGQDFVLWMSGPEGGGRLVASRLLVAGGCYDMPLPVAGWTIPGVMSAGGLQAFIKSQLLVPGDRFVLAGTHPLQLVVAAQIIEHGGRVESVLFSQPLRHFLKEMLRSPLVALRHAGPLLAGAAAYLSLLRAGVVVRFDAPIERIEGEGCVAGIQWRGSTPGEVACDRVALCYGFLPQSDLPRSVGAKAKPVESTGGWAICHDEWMRSSVPGLYVAGETAGVGGAEVALREGRLAGLAIALDSGNVGCDAVSAEARRLRKRRDSLRGFASLLERLASPHALLGGSLPAETIICRCEDIAYADLRDALSGRVTPSTANALKLATRAGMGLCQGRGCEHVVLRMIESLRADGSSKIGFTARYPVRPVPISDLLE